MTEAFLLSFRLASLTALTLLVLGVPLAYALVFKRVPLKPLLEAVLLLPLTLPPTVLGYYLLVLLAPEGVLGRWGLDWAFTFQGIWLGSVIFSLPFALTAFREAFQAVEPEVLEVARTLGLSTLKRWRRVLLPWVWPGLLSGTLLAFAHTLGEFGVVLMIGGNLPGETRVASIYIFDLVQALEFEEAARAASVFVLLSFVLVLGVRFLEARWRSITGSNAR
ncbi:MAG TPA: molybdate ABC transporter permease subunit [Oceanithermus profundus]|uniref:Molybdenum transport system permease n=1 Tax=Oceanithermus profundus TaxID=187137 RepID=A0A7C4ZHA8_9DEIN|nr:molybdate ABC transporter permease subunit [Oceanithermus profundus]